MLFENINLSITGFNTFYSEIDIKSTGVDINYIGFRQNCFEFGDNNFEIKANNSEIKANIFEFKANDSDFWENNYDFKADYFEFRENSCEFREFNIWITVSNAERMGSINYAAPPERQVFRVTEKISPHTASGMEPE